MAETKNEQQNNSFKRKLGNTGTPEPTATEKEQDKDTFSIYRLKDGDGMRDYHFEPYDRLQAVGLSVETANRL